MKNFNVFKKFLYIFLFKNVFVLINVVFFVLVKT